MTQPKLTPAQQLVFYWLSRSPKRCIYELGIRRFRLMLWDRRVDVPRVPPRSSIVGLCRLSTNRALVESGAVVRWTFNGRVPVWVHPKFAGGTDD